MRSKELNIKMINTLHELNFTKIVLDYKSTDSANKKL